MVRRYRIRERRRDGAAPPHCTFPTHGAWRSSLRFLSFRFRTHHWPRYRLTVHANKSREPRNASIGPVQRNDVVYTRAAAHGFSRPPRLASTTSKRRPAVDAALLARRRGSAAFLSRNAFTFHAYTGHSIVRIARGTKLLFFRFVAPFSLLLRRTRPSAFLEMFARSLRGVASRTETLQ